MALCGYGRVTLWRRIKRGKMPNPIDRGARGQIWLRDDVLKALNIIGESPDKRNPWDMTPKAEAEFRALLASKSRVIRNRNNPQHPDNKKAGT